MKADESESETQKSRYFSVGLNDDLSLRVKQTTAPGTVSCD